MSRTDKQLSYEERYKQKMEKYKEVYKMRTDFASKFKLKPEKTKGYYLTGDVEAGTKSTNSNADDSASQKDYSQIEYDPNGMTKEELINVNLQGSCGISEDELNAWIAKGAKNNRCVVCGGNHMEGRAAAFLQGEKEFGIRADAFISHAAHETGWGSSRICHDKSNFYGIGAFDASPYASAHGWDGYNGGITGGMGWISENYVYRSKKHSGKPDQSTFYLMRHPQSANAGHAYATDAGWHTKIASIWAGAPKGKAVSSTSQGSNQQSTPNVSKNPTIKSMDFHIKEESNEVNIIDEDSKHFMEYAVPMNVPPGTFRYGRYVPPAITRRDYARYRLENAYMQRWEGWAPLDGKAFIHLSGPQENLYSPEAQNVFNLLRMKLDMNIIKVIHGFEPRLEPGVRNMHNVGMAMDIYVSNVYEALYVADTAWTMGVRAIAIGGSELDASHPGFVHIDCGPKAFWPLNEHDVYKGPNTFKVIKR